MPETKTSQPGGGEFAKDIPGLRLMPGVRIAEIQDFDLHAPEKHLSALKALKSLTGASRLSEVGQHGPPNAAAVTEGNKGVQELNLYQVFFPRDAHIVSLFLREQFPQLTDATIEESLKYTGVRENLHSTGLKDEQELWKVPHETRDGKTDPRAQKHSREKDWGWPYYGAIDTTAKNINAIVYRAQTEGLPYLKKTYEGLDSRQHTYEEALQGHTNWLRKRMNLNPEGLVEALWLNPKHHANQNWTDSPDALHHADGSWAQHHPEKNWGVAPLEVQSEVYDALLNTAEIYQSMLGQADPERRQFLEQEVDDLTKRAAGLKKVILEKFWVEDTDTPGGGYFARGTDRDEAGNLRQLKIRSGDMGHLLNSRVLDGDDPEIAIKREAVIRNIFSDELLGANGVRTLATDSVRYWQEAYHNGNSWIWQTYYIALGLQKHGYYGLSYDLKKRAWSVYETTKILPEYATGSNDISKKLVSRKIVIDDPSLNYGKTKHQISQPPQEIQAWTVAAITAMKYEQGKRIFRKKGSVPTEAIEPAKRSLEQELLAA